MLVDGAANAADMTPTASPPMAPDRRRLLLPGRASPPAGEAGAGS
jgi:hypothetical protein